VSLIPEETDHQRISNKKSPKKGMKKYIKGQKSALAVLESENNRTVTFRVKKL
jgi:hypothetical protein